MRTRPAGYAPLILIGLCLILLPLFSYAQNPTDLQKQIAEYNKNIEALEREIAQYEGQLKEVGAEKQTLQRAIRELEISRNQIQAKIRVAQNEISGTALEITELSQGIVEKEDAISRGQDALGAAIRSIHEDESRSLVEAILSSDALSDVWNDIALRQQFQVAMQDRIDSLVRTKRELEESKQASEVKHTELVSHQKNLSAQQQALDINRREQNELLSVTKEKESNYQTILDEKLAAKEAFESALLDLESQLEYTLDPSRLPPSGKGILRWPLDTITVTQTFGDTEFARSGAYNGSGHNGVDFRASIGTPVKAALSGVVQGTGNTDAVPGCYSYGKWVLIRHNNGLSTLYAHLSNIGVSSGQQVATGELIGHSGNSGYSTGPHLHFTTYASSEVRLVRFGDVRTRTNCADATIPVAPLKAYLNPLDYL